MKIRQIRLRNFKRFSDTTIGDIPVEARLVVLVGPNGCGKSSIMDAAFTFHRHHWARQGGWDETYHLKQVAGATGNVNQAVQLEVHGQAPQNREEQKKAIYVRTAYRNDPEFQLGQLSRVAPATNENRFSRLIDNDQAVSQNYQRLVAEGFEYAYEAGNPDESLADFRARSIGEIRDSMERLFPDLQLNSLGNPLTEGTFRFDKGDSKTFLYKNLSGGEKAAFDLLLDILVKRREYNDTVFLIDEPETHISTGLQGDLLEEMLRLIPENSQLWIATHSLGMMRKARELGRANPAGVVFLDFDGHNFDVPSVVEPSSPDRTFWKRAMQIALYDIAGYVAPETIVVCEGSVIAGGSDFDATCYNTIFGIDYPEVVFLGGGSSDEVRNDSRGVTSLVRGITEDTDVIRVIDRDDHTDEQIQHANRTGVCVLSWRTIESYLIHDDVLTAVCETLGHPDRAPALIHEKHEALRQSIAAGGPADDLRRIAGDTYNAAKRLFPEHKLGSNNRAFMSGICAPHVRNCPAVYGPLRQDIFGEE